MSVFEDVCSFCERSLPDPRQLYCSQECQLKDRVKLSPLTRLHDPTPSPAPASTAAAPSAPFEAVRQRDAQTPQPVALRRKFNAIYCWLDHVKPGLDESEDSLSAPQSPIESADPPALLLCASSSSPRAARFPLSVSCVDPPRIAPLHPVPDDMESLCPPTLSLSAEDDSQVVTPPTQSIAAAAVAPVVLVVEPPLRSGGRFDDYTHRLRQWRVCAPADEAAVSAILTVDELMPVGVEAANFYRLRDEYPVPVESLRPHTTPHSRYTSPSSSPPINIPRGRSANDRRLR